MSRGILATIKSEDFRETLRLLSKYILSHHEETNYDRCFVLYWKDKAIPICARCSGIYLGIIWAFPASFFLDPLSRKIFLVVAILPLLTLVDWSLVGFGVWKGHNLSRFITGFLCGFAYALGIFLLISDFHRIDVLQVGLCYMLGVASVIKLARRKTKNPLPS